MLMRTKPTKTPSDLIDRQSLIFTDIGKKSGSVVCFLPISVKIVSVLSVFFADIGKNSRVRLSDLLQTSAKDEIRVKPKPAAVSKIKSAFSFVRILLQKFNQPANKRRKRAVGNDFTYLLQEPTCAGDVFRIVFECFLRALNRPLTN